MEELIDPAVDLHIVALHHEAPTLLTPSALRRPIDDFSTLYRMSTGVFGMRTYWTFTRPFPYARPYINHVDYGSPLTVEIVVPTILLGPAAYFGLPRLLDLLKAIVLWPSDVRRERAENIAARQEAEVRRRRQEAILTAPGLLEDVAEAALRRDIAEAQIDEAYAIAEAAGVLDRLPAESRDALVERYGERGVGELVGISRRSARGPVVPTDLDVRPAEHPERLPTPRTAFPEPVRESCLRLS